jgi:hypothetical protein
MQYCRSNIGQAPTIITSTPTAAHNISNPSHADFIAAGWLVYAPSPLPYIKESRWVENDGHYSQVDIVQFSEQEKADIATAEDVKAAERQAAAAAADLAANGERYVAENEYILLCDLLGQCPGAHVKLGMGALQTLMVSLISTVPARENALFQYLMGLQIALQRLGGVGWWDACAWHDQPVIVNAAEERHNAIVGVLPV